MDREIWRTVMRAIRTACAEVKDPGRTPVYPNWMIVAMYIWSVWHDRCLSWACDRSHYGGIFRPRGKLPSISQFTRRVKTDVCQQILQHVHGQLARAGVGGFELSCLDGKPLLVGPASKDRDAKGGKITGGFAKGYKLHAFANEQRRIVVWSVMPLNVAEQTVAMALCDDGDGGHLPPVLDGRHDLTLADSNYDSAPLYTRLASQGRALLAPLKAQQKVDPIRGHRPASLRQMGPARREALAVWKHHATLAWHVLKQRNNIEGVFSVLATALGLDHLPTFVRTLGRVRRWVGAKIILYHARLEVQARARLVRAA